MNVYEVTTKSGGIGGETFSVLADNIEKALCKAIKEAAKRSKGYTNNNLEVTAIELQARDIVK